MHPLLNIAYKAARRGGDVIVRAVDRLDKITVTEKQHNDFVTEVDRQAEVEIIDVIRRTYPEHGVIAEESGEYQSNADYVWIIDPLDGTTNFVHGFPQFAVAIAIKTKDKIEHGLIYDPLRQEVFTASRGQGAYMNDRRMRVSENANLNSALLGTGFPYTLKDQFDRNINILIEILKQTGDLRRAGSAALDLAYVACGRLDGYWECGLKIWDIAAGALMVKEAGGFVSGLSGADDALATGNIIATNSKLFKKLLQVIKPLAS